MTFWMNASTYRQYSCVMHCVGANKHVNCPIIEPERRSISHFLQFLLFNLCLGVEGSECDWIILLEWDYGLCTCIHSELEQLDYVIFSIFSFEMKRKNNFSLRISQFLRIVFNFCDKNRWHEPFVRLFVLCIQVNASCILERSSIIIFMH